MTTTQTEQTKPVAKIFKSYMPFLRLQFNGLEEAVFRNHRLVTKNAKLIAKLADLCENDQALGIYVDPNEYETEVLPPDSAFDIRQQQLREFMQQQTTQIDAGTTDRPAGIAVATTADSPTTGGKSAAAPHFTTADTKALLASRTAETPKPTT